MTIENFVEAIGETFPGVTIYRDVVEIAEGEVLPKPYAYFITGETESFNAGNVTYFSSTPVNFFWVEDNPSEDIAQKMRDFLTSIRKPYRESSGFQDELGAFVHEFDFSIY